MAVTTYLLSSLLMAVALLAVGSTALRVRAWQHSPVVDGTDGERTEFAALLRHQTTWTVGFVAIVLGLLVSTLAYLDGVAGSQVVLLSLLGGMVVSYIIVGVYYAAASRGHPHSYAVAESVTALGALFIVAIVATLLMG